MSVMEIISTGVTILLCLLAFRILLHAFEIICAVVYLTYVLLKGFFEWGKAVVVLPIIKIYISVKNDVNYAIRSAMTQVLRKMVRPRKYFPNQEFVFFDQRISYYFRLVIFYGRRFVFPHRMVSFMVGMGLVKLMLLSFFI